MKIGWVYVDLFGGLRYMAANSHGDKKLAWKMYVFGDAHVCFRAAEVHLLAV